MCLVDSSPKSPKDDGPAPVLRTIRDGNAPSTQAARAGRRSLRIDSNAANSPGYGLRIPS